VGCALSTSAVSIVAAGQPGQASGGEMTNAGPQKARFDSQHRPITASGFVKSGPVVFIDATKQAGLSKWRNVTGTPDKGVIIEAKGSGVRLLDYDNDGWLDIYLVNGSTLDALAGKAASPHAALFRNNHDGTFTDVTANAGVGNDRWGTGCVVGHYDNDGWPDLYVTNVGASRLYHNNHDGTFTDVAMHAGVALDEGSADVAIDHTGATFGTTMATAISIYLWPAISILIRRPPCCPAP
jgi:enediyne biosynthesis protein E4